MQTFLLVGDGRLAHHLKFWLGLKGHTLRTWDRSQDPHLLKSYINEATHILLAVSDDAIQSVYQRYFMDHEKPVIHFSGSRTFEGVIGLHPLMTFSHELYEENFYDRISWAVEEGYDFNSIFPTLPNKSFQIPRHQKSLYHALCVIGGNIPQILWSLVEDESKKLNIPREAWESYWQKSLENFSQLGKSAVTGPFVRNDMKTLEGDRLALANSPALAKIFQEFIEITQKNDFKSLMTKEVSL